MFQTLEYAVSNFFFTIKLSLYSYFLFKIVAYQIELLTIQGSLEDIRLTMVNIHGRYLKTLTCNA